MHLPRRLATLIDELVGKQILESFEVTGDSLATL
jgi:hypothetical protein